MYEHVHELWKRPKKNLGYLWKSRITKWREENTVTRVEHPTRIDRARSIGYKAKQGFAVARVCVKKGSRKRPKVAGGRIPKHAGRFFSPGKSKQRIAEEKAASKFTNMEVLGSYYVGEDGEYKWFECVLVDPAHPSVLADRERRWIADPQHKRRVFRGLTPAGRRGRGLINKGLGAEKLRPSRAVSGPKKERHGINK